MEYHILLESVKFLKQTRYEISLKVVVGGEFFFLSFWSNANFGKLDRSLKHLFIDIFWKEIFPLHFFFSIFFWKVLGIVNALVINVNAGFSLEIDSIFYKYLPNDSCL